jgi:hypothetical protein
VKKTIFPLLLFGFTTAYCQTFIVTENNMIVNRDTSAYYGICGDTLSIDVNSDNKIDFTIRHTCPIEECCQDVGYMNCDSNQSQYISIRAYSNFETFNFGVVSILPANYNYNDTLDKYQGYWSHGGWIMAEFYGGPGCFTYYNVGNWWGDPGYLIFRNPNNDDPVYGWIEIQATTSNLGFQLYGFGIENKKINGLADNRLDGIKIVSDDDHISLTNIKDKIYITLIALNGRIVYKQIISSDTDIKIDHFQSGLYILHVSDDQSTLVKKIIK